MSDLGVRRPGLPLSSNERSTANADSAETHTSSTNSAANVRADHIETTDTGNYRAEPGTTTNVDRVATDLLQVKGSLSSPRVIVDPATAVGQVQNGNIEVRIPLNNGHRIGPAKVREDTFVKANLVIKNGKIDRENTRILFENANGERTDLDGPFIWDAEQIYIDAEGQLKADVPCFPDPNITKQVFGADADAVPEKIEDFIKLLDRQGQMLGKQELIQDYSMSNLSESAARTSPDHVGAADDLGSHSNRGTHESAALRNTSTRSEPKNGLTNAFRFTETQLQFSGTLKTGPMSFGDGLDLQIAPNTHVQGSGTLGDIDLTLDGHISSLEMKSKDSLLTTKDGSIKITAQIHSARHTDGSLDRSANKTIDCVISELKSNDIYFETPGIDNKHRLKLDSFALNSSTHETPIARFTRDYAKSYPEMTLNLPDVSMKGLSADIEIKGADGKAANFLIGHGLNEENREGVDLRGSITYDSTTNDFTFDATTKDLDARLVAPANTTDESVVELVESEHFNLSLNEAVISGSGAISIHSSAGTSELKLDADDDNPWTFKVDVEDASFKGNPAETNLALDLSTDTHGILRLDTLNLGKGRMPEFQGDAEFAVTLDALNFKTTDIPELNIKKGTQGTLTVHSMGWNEGDVSPTIDATLKLDLGADALLDIENIPGLEGARLNVDAETGNTCLLIDVQMQGDGTVHSQVDLNLKGLFLRTDFERGDAKVANLPELDLPDTPIPNTGSMELLDIDTSTLTEGPQNLSETELLESYVPTNLPNFSINPMEVFSVLDKAQVTLRLGLKRTRLNIAKADLTTERGIFNDRIGVAYKLDLNVPDGNLTGKLHVVNGKIAADVSVLRFSPPIKVYFDGDAYGPGPLEGDLDATATISSIKIRRDSNGRGYLEPQYDIDMTGALGIADLVDYFDSDDSLVKSVLDDYIPGILTSTIFGSETIPLEEKAFLKQLNRQFPSLGQPIEINAQELLDAALPQGNVGSSSNAATETNTGGNTSNAGASASNTHSNARTRTNNSSDVSRMFDLTKASLLVSHTELKPTTLQLGDGQFISFAEGSKLKVSGTTEDFTISGAANISSLKLGKKDLGVELGESSINVEIKVKAGLNGAPPQVEMKLSDINTSDLNLNGKVPSGDISITNAKVENASLQLRVGGNEPEEFVLKMPHLEGELKGIIAPPVADSEKTPTVIALEHALIKGNIELNSRGEVKITDSIFSEISGTVIAPPLIDKNLAGELENANYNLEFKQVDIRGSAKINVDGAKWSISSTQPGEATIKAKAIANDASFYIVGPQISLDLAPQAEIEMALEHLSIGDEGEVQFSAKDFYVLGSLDAGHITIAAPTPDEGAGLDALIPKTVGIEPGSRVAINLDHFSANFTSIEDTLKSSGTLRLEGSLLEPEKAEDLAHESDLGNIHLKTATLHQGDFHMMVALETDGLGNIAATSKTLLDVNAHLEIEGKVRTEEAYNMLETLEENE